VEVKSLVGLQKPDKHSLMWSVWAADPASAAELVQHAVSQIELAPDVPRPTL